jgi:micrococcal nuclease
VLYIDAAVLLRALLQSICFTLLAAALVALTPGGVHADGVRGRVSAIVDGDTIHIDIDGHSTVVRLLGVDAPELHDRDDPAGRPQPFARAAADFTRRMLADRRVRLEFEPDDRLDRYGRTLAYVFLDDGTFFNGELLRQGYAHAYTGFALRYRAELDADEAVARRARRGLWTSAATPLPEPIIANRKSGLYHLPGQAHYHDVAESNRIYFQTEDAARAAGFQRALR